MERTVDIAGRRIVVTLESSLPSDVSSSVSQANTKKSAPQLHKKPQSKVGAYHCGLCDAYFWDSAAVAAHKASRRHRENTGELARDKMMYKPDAEVTVADIQLLIEKKRLEKGVVPLSQMRPQPTSNKRQRSEDNGVCCVPPAT